jgi:hypoxanthine-DNA glycosylase
MTARRNIASVLLAVEGKIFVNGDSQGLSLYVSKSARPLIKTQGFPPVINADIVTLLLGSFPSAASLQQVQYYAHPRNQFWRLVGAVIGEPLAKMEYSQRLQTLLEHRIGLWDVISACHRPGSLDADIRQASHNDFIQVIGLAKGLRRVCFNGKTAGRQAPLFRSWGYETLVLPSSSPAHAALSYEEKLKAWRKIIASAGVDPA